jgi:hypothetical protein
LWKTLPTLDQAQRQAHVHRAGKKHTRLVCHGTGSAAGDTAAGLLDQQKPATCFFLVSAWFSSYTNAHTQMLPSLDFFLALYIFVFFLSSGDNFVL